MASFGGTDFSPTNSFVGPMLTDMYQISMCYAYWINGKADDRAVFEMFFRKNPFHGEYCIFAGQDEVLKLLSTFRFTTQDVEYLKGIMPTCDDKFFEWLLTLDCSGVTVYAMEEGSVVFPREPLLSLEGPLAVVQLLETVLLNLVNFPSLVATNAARMRLAAGHNKTLLEFGLRRAQGPDGGMSASKYAFLGGFDGTSNVLAGKIFDISVKGTHAHSFVMSYMSLAELHSPMITFPAVTDSNTHSNTNNSSNNSNNNNSSSSSSNVPGSNQEAAAASASRNQIDFLALVIEKRKQLGCIRSNEGELAAFIAYAQSFPSGFLALVDTYDTLYSGVQNFLCVAWALYEIGYAPIGVRLDSGDLAYLSRAIRQTFRDFDNQYFGGKAVFSALNIVASNDINEDVLMALNREGHEIDTFGIGTHLATCQKQPALGCVFKLVEINGQPRIKLSQEMEKLAIPGRKRLFRLYGQDGKPLVDLMQTMEEAAPVPNERILVRHAFEENKRAYVRPLVVKPLLRLIYDGARCSNTEILKKHAAATVAGAELQNKGHLGIVSATRPLHESRALCMRELQQLRQDHIRPLNPTPYKVSISPTLYDYMHKLWLDEAPIADLS